jgi:hypothetical protein
VKNGRLLTFAVLALASLVIVLERCHTFSEPLERDITTYAVIGEELLKGRSLYSDLWDHKPPAIHLTYALAEAVAGEGPSAVFLLNVLAALATLAGLYQAGKSLGGRAGGFWAAAIWAVVSGDLVLQANQPNEEVFLNLFQTWVFVLWVSASAKNPEPRRWVLIGLLSAIASLYKPFAVLEALLLSAATLALNWKPLAARGKALRQAALVFGCVFTAWILVFGWFALQGRWHDFKNAVFTYNVSYSGYENISFRDFLQTIGGQALDFKTLTWLLLLFVLGCLGAFLRGRAKDSHGPWLFWTAFLVAAELEVLSPGHFFAHYNQLLVPPLILGAAWGITGLSEKIERRTWKCLPGALVLALLIFHEAPFYRLSPEEWANRKYAADGPLFIRSYQLGRELDALLGPGQTFYEWGNESELYFAARRSPPSGVVYSYPLLDSPLAMELSRRVIGDLEREKPEAVVLNMSYYVTDPNFLRHPLLQWLRVQYRYSPGNPYRKPFALLVRKGGALEKKLLGEAVNLPSKSKP